MIIFRQKCHFAAAERQALVGYCSAITQLELHVATICSTVHRPDTARAAPRVEVLLGAIGRLWARFAVLDSIEPAADAPEQAHSTFQQSRG